jgi:transcription elongation factor S-II
MTAEDQILRCAVALEAYVYSENPPPEGTAVYRTKMRSFMLNLKAKNNPSLREDVVSGDISIPRLYTMTPAVRTFQFIKLTLELNIWT